MHLADLETHVGLKPKDNVSSDDDASLTSTWSCLGIILHTVIQAI